MSQDFTHQTVVNGFTSGLDFIDQMIIQLEAG